MKTTWDAIIIGGGHAGIEAAAAATRLGAAVCLVTPDPDAIGRMSCNPAIGGLAKGQLAREVDALGGVMALACDATSIHSRILGTGKGPAIWSPRAQCDKGRYESWMRNHLLGLPRLTLVPGAVVAITTDAMGHVAGVDLASGTHLSAPRVVLTTGTFLDGELHTGTDRRPGGRRGEAPARGLSANLRALGLTLVRMKTGTPPRLHPEGIAWEDCIELPGDLPPRPISYRSSKVVLPQVSCHTTWTTPAAHAHIRSNLDRAPLFNGQISSIGPRYCPSIEDKAVRFPDRDAHQLVLEPEDLERSSIYVNGLSTSLPEDIQLAVLRAIPALARARVARFGYAVEYDAVVTDQLDHHLAVRQLPGLYCAGQINCTSGYEEAAIQGLVAGANAILSHDGRSLRLLRHEAYGGVLIDDLVTRVPDEPYRMFTSRAEYRLSLRADNADRRLTSRAAELGLVDAVTAAAVRDKDRQVTALVAMVPVEIRHRIAGQALGLEATVSLVGALAQTTPAIAEAAWIDLRYGPYLERQASRLKRLDRLRCIPIPPGFVYQAVDTIGHECRQRLDRARPASLGEAADLAGVGDADIEMLWVALRDG